MCSNTIRVSLLQMKKERWGGLLLFGTNTQYVLVSNCSLNWTKAQSFCRSHYHDLVSVLDSHTHVDVKKLLPNKDSVFWIGLSSEERSWRWSLQDPRFNQTYRSWKNGQPDQNLHKDCVIMMEEGWKNVDCSNARYSFACEDLDSVPARVVVMELNRRWATAQQFCRQNYTDLVTVSNWDENEFLKQLMEDKEVEELWIGLNRPLLEWRWSDGSTFQFSGWHKQQGGGAKGAAACVVMAKHGWMSTDCSERFDFLCYQRTVEKEGDADVRRTSVRMRVVTQANLEDPAVKRGLSQQLEAELVRHGHAHLIYTDVKAEPRDQKTANTCKMTIKP